MLDEFRTARLATRAHEYKAAGCPMPVPDQVPTSKRDALEGKAQQWPAGFSGSPCVKSLTPRTRFRFKVSPPQDAVIYGR